MKVNMLDEKHDELYKRKTQKRTEADYDPAVIEVRRILRPIGLNVSTTGHMESERCIVAYKTLVRCHEVYGEKIFYHAMNLLAWTWKCDRHTLNAQFIKGICLFTRAYAQCITYEDFVYKLRYIDPYRIYCLAQQDNSSKYPAVRYARIFLNFYNKNRKTKIQLPDILVETSKLVESRPTPK